MAQYRCNSCWTSIDSATNADAEVVVTSCLHLFCATCSAVNFSDEKSLVCPACSNTLDAESVRLIRIKPLAADVDMQLWGMRPSEIGEIAHAAIAFHDYQKQQEQQWLLATIEQLQREVNTLTSNAKDAGDVQQSLSHLEEKLDAIIQKK